MALLEHMVYNYIDFLILKKYYQSCFCSERRLGKWVHFLLHGFCAIVLSIVNVHEIPILNLVSTITLMGLFIYSYKRVNLMSLILYIGIGFVAEPIGFFLTGMLTNSFPALMSYRISMAITLIIRYVLIYFVCKFREIHMYELPRKVKVALGAIPIVSISECCIAIDWYWQSKDKKTVFLGMAIVFVSILINFIVFWIFEQYQLLSEKNHQNNLAIMEAESKELYYQEVEESNLEIRTIRHDLKNVLLGILALPYEKMKTNLSEMVNELENSERVIFTANIVLNTILNSKQHITQEKQIDYKVDIRVPQKLNLDYRDAGILIGNLLDNAIEAAEQVQMDNRWIRVKIVFKQGILIAEISNSKLRQQLKPTYKLLDKKNHGLGLKSVQRIVDKYNGSLDTMDHGEEYEVTVVLYGIHVL